MKTLFCTAILLCFFTATSLESQAQKIANYSTCTLMVKMWYTNGSSCVLTLGNGGTVNPGSPGTLVLPAAPSGYDYLQCDVGWDDSTPTPPWVTVWRSSSCGGSFATLAACTSVDVEVLNFGSSFDVGITP